MQKLHEHARAGKTDRKEDREMSKVIRCPGGGTLKVIKGIPDNARIVSVHEKDGPAGGIINRCNEVEYRCPCNGRKYHVKFERQ